MNFCSDCGCLLLLDQSYTFVCSQCPFSKVMEILNVVFRSEKCKSGIIMNLEEFKYAATCQIKCRRCGNDRAAYIEMQTRSADEPATLFYCCTACKETWRE